MYILLIHKEALTLCIYILADIYYNVTNNGKNPLEYLFKLCNDLKKKLLTTQPSV